MNAGQNNPLDTYSRYFPAHIKERGLDILRENRLDIVDSGPDGYFAVAYGTEEYDVQLLASGKPFERLGCTCPYAADGQLCKHMWALLLAIEAAERRPARPAKVQPRQSSWQPIINDAMREEDISLASDSDFGEHLIYRLTRPPTQIANNVEVELFFRERKKNGDLTVPKPLRLRRGDLEMLPLEADRNILGDLILLLPEHTAWSSLGRLEHIRNTVHLAGPRMPAILENMARTGRLLLGNSSTQKDYWQPIEWMSHPTALHLIVEETPNSDSLSATLELRADGERLLAGHSHFFDQRLLLYSNRIYPLDNPGSLTWLREFLAGREIRIARKEWPEFYSNVMSLVRRPEMELPDSLKPREIEATPQPHLRLAFRPHDPRAEGSLSFLYPEGIEIADGPQRLSIDESASTVLLCNLTAHAQARAQLREAGLQPYEDAETGQPLWGLPLPRFSTAVQTLLDAGWIVEAEGRPVRTARATSVRITTGISWFDVEGTADFDGLEATLPELMAALRAKSRYVRLGDGSIGLLPEDWMSRYALLSQMAKEKDGVLRLSRHQGPLLDAMLAAREESGETLFADEAFLELRRKLRTFDGIRAAPQPEGFVGQMRPYQLEGLAWLHFLDEYGLGGCLADDMGVGKTIQMLAWLEERRARRAAGEEIPPDLVVVPKSLLFNWLAEASRFTPKLTLLDYTGTARNRKAIPNHDVTLTTYGTLRRDITALTKFEFGAVILDESQAIKNAASDSAKAVRLLQGCHRFAMTGTPIENHLGEIWSLFEFLNPGLLGPQSNWKVGANLDDELRESLRRTLRPLILRRTKKQVASDLPERTEQVLYCDLEPEQRKVYNALLAQVRKDLDAKIASSGLAKSKLHVLEALLRLRQAACHPRLLLEKSDAPSAKFDVLLEQIAEIVDEGHKALIFSQFTSLLALLQPELDKLNIPYEYLDGQTRDRKERVERFQAEDGPPLFLLSLKAGGIGLNLTAADYVYLLDPWWNPAVEAQAIDRTHRIGQSRPIFAYRLVAKNTIEERILELQQSKRDLAEAILSADNALIASLKREDLDYLLS